MNYSDITTGLVYIQ